MRYFILIISLVAILNAASFQRDTQLQIVIDKEHPLVWMDSEANVKLYFTHEEAEKYCEDLLHGTYSNWRLPEIEELELIVDKNNPPRNINRAFRYSLNEGYWASTAHWRTLWFYADYMHFVSGTPYFDSRHKQKLVRCVRTGK
ncbi:MAG: DUF1566 domain-containing protein [Arcobacter sp.]|uniref:Lcl C-terminal domain-containing protein n=1 Tax=Arcobacter sp. TaxID=1872629 RepID=UPI003B00D6B1